MSKEQIVNAPPLPTDLAISVIIPMYNAENYIGECLDSILGQTFQDFEVIVVDDCSTDNSVEVVENYLPKFNGRLRLEKTEENSGGGGYVPRNIGLNLARGEYIFFVDADDFILLTALETLYTAAKENEADVVYNGACYVLRQPNDIYSWRDHLSDQLIAEGIEDNPNLIVDDSDKILNQLIVTGLHHMPYTKFLRRDFLLENNIDFPKIISGGDFIWTIHVFSCSKRCLRLPGSLYFYRSNPNSITLEHKSLEEQISKCVKAFSLGAETLLKLSDKVELLKREPNYLYYALKPFWNNFLRRTYIEREKSSPSDIYEILYREFGKQRNLPGYIMSFLVGIADEAKKLDKERLQTVDKLNKKIDSIKDALITSKLDTDFLVPKRDLPTPAVSIVIPLHNAEKYIGECLDSLLAQTFQDFEVVVVDDCSTDSSCEIVENYAPKFDGRLRLHRLKENSGSGGVPRNKGILLSNGEYIKFLDADDMLTNTALAELYSLAKEYDADVVHCPRNYTVDNDGSNLRIAPKLPIEVPTLEPQDFKELMVKVVKKGYGATYCQFVRRNIMIENDVFFPQIYPSEDYGWFYNLIFFVKRFLSAPNAVYIIRASEDSMMRKKRTPQEIIKFRLNAALFGITPLDKSLNHHKFLIDNPFYHYHLLERFLSNEVNQSIYATQNLSDDEIYSTIKDAFGNKFGYWNVLIPVLCTELYKSKRKENNQNKLIDMFKRFINAKIDIKFDSKKDDCQILNISDDKASITTWEKETDTIYNISSIAGILTFVAKTNIKGKFTLILRGIDVRDPANKSKRIPYWIDYIKLTINGKTIFNKLTPTWCGKPYKIIMDTKANEEFKIQVEWLPHRNEDFEQKLLSSPPKVKNPIPRNFMPFITARMEVKLMSKEGDFQILSVSDSNARITKPEYLQKGSTCYCIHTTTGKIKMVTKSSVDGQVRLLLRSMDIRDPKDNTKRIPYWLDYKNLVINSKKIFDTSAPICYDKFFGYNVDVKANEETEVEVEWLPHRSDTPSKKLLSQPLEEKILRNFMPFITARMEVKLMSKEGDFQILSVSDSNARITKPEYLQKGSTCYCIHTTTGKIKMITKSSVDGQVRLLLRSMDIRDPKDNTKHIPYWLDYKNFVINGKKIFDTSAPICYDKFFGYNVDVKANEETAVEVEWLPHRSDTP